MINAQNVNDRLYGHAAHVEGAPLAAPPLQIGEVGAARVMRAAVQPLAD